MQEEVSIINTTIFRRPTCEKESWNLAPTHLEPELNLWIAFAF